MQITIVGFWLQWQTLSAPGFLTSRYLTWNHKKVLVHSRLSVQQKAKTPVCACFVHPMCVNRRAPDRSSNLSDCCPCGNTGTATATAVLGDLGGLAAQTSLLSYSEGYTIHYSNADAVRDNYRSCLADKMLQLHCDWGPDHRKSIEVPVAGSLFRCAVELSPLKS